MLTGEQLRTIRNVLGLSGEDIAKAMYITKQSVSSIETGKTKSQSSINYYYLSLKEIIRNLDDEQMKDTCYKVLDIFESSKRP